MGSVGKCAAGFGLAAACIATLASAASAAVTVYYDEATFNAAITNQATDTFSDVLIANYSLPWARQTDVYGYDIWTSSANGFVGRAPGADPFVAARSRFDTIQAGNFTNAPQAFGANFLTMNSGGSPNSGAVMWVAVAYGNTLEQFAIAPSGRSTFLGFTSSDPLKGVSFTLGDQAGYWPGIDNITFGQIAPIPEPGIWATMLLGFGMIGFSMRRRSRGGILQRA